MAQSYTPGLQVLSNTVSEQTRHLPLKGRVLVQVDDIVLADTVIASAEIPGNVQMLNVSRQLNIDVDALPSWMLVEIDEIVEKNQLIAESKGFFGGSIEWLL